MSGVAWVVVGGGGVGVVVCGLSRPRGNGESRNGEHVPQFTGTRSVLPVHIVRGYERNTFLRTTVSLPPLLGPPYPIQPYGGPPRADKNLQRIANHDEGSDDVVVVAM